MFLSRNKKNNVYPCKPQFYYIKMGFKEVKIIQVCLRDVNFDYRVSKMFYLRETSNCRDTILTFSALGKNFSRLQFKIIFLLSPGNSCCFLQIGKKYEIETICMKCLNLLSGENKKISICSLLN